jgi:hypothetical protein
LECNPSSFPSFASVKNSNFPRKRSQTFAQYISEQKQLYKTTPMKGVWLLRSREMGFTIALLVLWYSATWLRAELRKETASNSTNPIAQADYDFEHPLALPGNIANGGGSKPDVQEGRPPSKQRQSAGPRQSRTAQGSREPNDRGGVSNGGRSTALLPPANVFDPAKDTKIELGNDPQIAVGQNFIIATEAHTIVFYDKKTGQPLPTPPQPLTLGQSCNKPEAGIRMEEFFAPFFAPFLNDSSGKPDRSRPNPQDINRHLEKPDLNCGVCDLTSLLVCDPDNPTSKGCINEAYDTRALYDPEHKQFWILSHLRNPIYNSGEQKQDHIVVPECTNLHQRFVAVAVSKDDNPLHGFHEFVVSHAVGDWPTVGLHGQFLLIGAATHKKVLLFDVEKLRKGNSNQGALSFGNIPESAFDSDQIWPVVQHDKRNGKPFIPTLPPGKGDQPAPTFLLGVGGSKITIYAFDPPLLFDQPGNGFISPRLMSASIELDGDIDTLDVRNNPVYRNGFIYLTGQHCLSGEGRSCNHEIRVIRIPVFRTQIGGVDSILGSNKKDLGFEDITFGGDDSSFNNLSSYEVPAIEVSKNNAAVVVYGRNELNPITAVNPPGAYYAALYQDRRGLLTDGLLQQAACTGSAKPACMHPGADASGLDLPGIAVDPADDTTVWMAHGFVDSTGQYRMIIGRVKP